MDFIVALILNAAKSREQGVPVHEGRDFVKIQHPGENLNIVDREATPQDKQRWATKWAQYSQGINQVPDGIPISLLFPHKPEIEATLRGYNIHTVEQLANLSAHGISTIGMGAQDWVTNAKKYLERAEKGVDHHKFETAMAAKDLQITTMQRQIDELTQLVHSKTAPIQRPPANFDYQEAQLNQVHASADDSQAFLQPPARMVADLSNDVVPSKPRGRPRGSKNKEKI